MAILDNYNLRWNTSLGVLEINLGGLDWEPLPLSGTLTGHATLDLPLTGGALTGALTFTGTTFAFTPPKVTTTQRDAIASPTSGMVIYNTTTNKLNVYTTAWEAVTSV